VEIAIIVCCPYILSFSPALVGTETDWAVREEGERLGCGKERDEAREIAESSSP